MTAKRHQARARLIAERLTFLVEHQHDLRRYADDWQEGFGASSSGDACSNTGPSDPTGRMATTRREGQGLAAIAIATADALDAIVDQINAAHFDAIRLLPIDDGKARSLADQSQQRFTGAGNCAACDCWCTGVDPDRLRSGFCPAHHRDWGRRGYPDRAAYIRMVRAQPDLSPTDGDNEDAGGAPHVA